jgi:(1->4)-alpha-D-glucan 1-alpha-D-glucosylmutase
MNRLDSAEERTSELATTGLTPAPGRVPTATYRLQFNAGFTFQDAARWAEYGADLGVTDLYASPVFQARAGSTHGYDVCDYNRLNPECGGEVDFEAMSEALQRRGLGLILDLVPNHMGIGTAANRPWMDLLELGRQSPFAVWFDLDWEWAQPGQSGRVLLPVLEDHYGSVLENGKLELALETDGLVVRYHQTVLPLAPVSWLEIVRSAFGTASGKSTKEARSRVQAWMQELAHWLEKYDRHLPLSEDAHGHWLELKRQLGGWLAADKASGEAVRTALAAFTGAPGQARSFDRLDQLLRAQNYRLVYWRCGPEEINYRRFFDITDLAGIRMEAPEVFSAAHRLVGRLLREGRVSGWRVDHPDGLKDPAQYFRRLQDLGSTRSEFPRDVPPGPAGSPPLYLVVEKILMPGESLPADWPMYGTTGYDFLNAVNGLLVRAESEAAFDRIYRDFSGLTIGYDEVVLESKRKILKNSLASEWRRLTHRLWKLAAADRHACDFTWTQLHEALGEWIAAFPVYRTYVTQETVQASPEDARHIEIALAGARRHAPEVSSRLMVWIGDVLQLRRPDEENLRAEAREFILRFQQLTGPVMAKGLEDTTFYVYHRFVSLNEVGGHPDHFGLTPNDFHAQNQVRAARRPHAMLATATHDTKRGEDVRARLDVLSEMPGEWERAVTRWTHINQSKKTVADGLPAPDRNDEYLVYQTLLGAWPMEPDALRLSDAFRDRITAYLRKAAREAKVHTSWTEQDAGYETALQRFAEACLADAGPEGFLADFVPFQKPLAFFGRLNSLAQTLLKITCPGVPDFYQGTELWDLHLVDPDNRHPVDFEQRRGLLDSLRAKIREHGDNLVPLCRQLLGRAESGEVKLYLIHQALQYRRRQTDLFASGTYRPLPAAGSQRDHVFAFGRLWKDQSVLVVVPRLGWTLAGGREVWPLGGKAWGDASLVLPVEIGRGQYRNILTGETHDLEVSGGSGPALGAILAEFPVALLERK